MSKEIPLTRGYTAIVDDEDYASLIQHSWRVKINPNGTVYASRGYRTPGKQHNIYMHRQILSPPDGLFIDHINRNGLDNRKENLRICTKRQNGHNSERKAGRFKGIRYHRRTSTWNAVIAVNNKVISLGYFSTPIGAARAYDKAAIKYFGEFARTNQMRGLINHELKSDPRLCACGCGCLTNTTFLHGHNLRRAICEK